MKVMTVITDIKVMDCTSDEGILTYYETKPIKCLPIDDVNPTLPPPEIITKYVKGTEFSMMDRDGKIHRSIIGFTDDVYEKLGFPLQAVSETVDRNIRLYGEKCELERDNSLLKSKVHNLTEQVHITNKAFVNYKNGINKMSWWKKLKFLFGGKPAWC